MEGILITVLGLLGLFVAWMWYEADLHLRQVNEAKMKELIQKGVEDLYEKPGFELDNIDEKLYNNKQIKDKYYLDITSLKEWERIELERLVKEQSNLKKQGVRKRHINYDEL